MGSHGTFDSNIPQKSRKASRLRVCRVFTKIASSDSIFFIPMKPGCFVYIYIYIPGFFEATTIINWGGERFSLPFLTFEPRLCWFNCDTSILIRRSVGVVKWIIWIPVLLSRWCVIGKFWNHALMKPGWKKEVDMSLKLGGGFKYFLFSSLFREDEPILTSIFFGWVETTNQPKHWVF